MDDRFNGWYKKSSIRIDGDTLNKRWAGIEQCYRNLSPRPWYDVVEVFLTAQRPVISPSNHSERRSSNSTRRLR